MAEARTPPGAQGPSEPPAPRALGGDAVAAGAAASASMPVIHRASRASSVRGQVYAWLHSEITRVVLIPGQRLSEADLAARLGVSRTPVRESLIQLAEEGLVDVVPQIGTFVARISLPDVRQAQFVREALECAALRLAVERITDADLHALEENLRAQREAQHADDFDRFHRLDDAFHRVLMDCSGHRGLWQVTQRAKAHLDRARRLSLPVPAVLGELIDQHEAIAKRVGEREADAADAALRTHLRMAFRLLGPLQQQYPDYFVDTGEASQPALGVES
jgi:DNA-binding GntR family transcriptional regulator